MLNGTMKSYRYSAVNELGVKVDGVIQAVSESDAGSVLRSKGLFVKALRGQSADRPRRAGRVNRDDFISFLTEFTSLVKAGLTVPESLEQCVDRPADKGLGQALKEAHAMLMQGETLSGALDFFPRYFDRVMISAVRTGEASGDLAGPLQKYREHYERRVQISKKLSAALVYPVFILSVMILVLAGIFIFVMPRFTALYADFDAELPAATRVMLFAAENIAVIAPVSLLAILSVFAIWAAAEKNVSFRRWADGIKMRLPAAGVILEGFEQATMAGTLNTLLSGGMPLAEALENAARAAGNEVYRERAMEVYHKIHSGEHFSEAAGEAGLFPPAAVKLLKAGEASGAIDRMLAEIAVYNEQRAHGRLSALMTVIEPMMILITGFIVGAVIVAMYLPVFRLTEIIK